MIIRSSRLITKDYACYSREYSKIQNDQLEVTTTNPSTINEPVKPIENLETLKNVDPVLDNQSTDERKEVLTEVNEIIKEEDPVQEPLKDEPIDVPERPQNDEVKTGESSDLPPSDRLVASLLSCPC